LCTWNSTFRFFVRTYYFISILTIKIAQMIICKLNNDCCKIYTLSRSIQTSQNPSGYPCRIYYVKHPISTITDELAWKAYYLCSCCKWTDHSLVKDCKLKNTCSLVHVHGNVLNYNELEIWTAVLSIFSLLP